MSERTLKHLRIGMHHPRRPEPSRIELSIAPEDRKSDKIDVYTLTEAQLLDLIEQAIHSVNIMRALAR